MVHTCGQIILSKRSNAWTLDNQTDLSFCLWILSALRMLLTIHAWNVYLLYTHLKFIGCFFIIYALHFVNKPNK